MPDSLETILLLEEDIVALEAALAERPGNIESCELSQTLEHRAGQREALLAALDEHQRAELAGRREQRHDLIELGCDRASFLRRAVGAELISSDKARFVGRQLERVYSFEGVASWASRSIPWSESTKRR